MTEENPNQRQQQYRRNSSWDAEKPCLKERKLGILQEPSVQRRW